MRPKHVQKGKGGWIVGQKHADLKIPSQNLKTYFATNGPNTSLFEFNFQIDKQAFLPYEIRVKIFEDCFTKLFYSNLISGSCPALVRSLKKLNFSPNFLTKTADKNRAQIWNQHIHNAIWCIFVLSGKRNVAKNVIKSGPKLDQSKKINDNDFCRTELK